MAAKSDPGLPGPMDGAPKKGSYVKAPTQAPRSSVSATGPSEGGMSTVKRRSAPAVKTHGSNKGPR